MQILQTKELQLVILCCSRIFDLSVSISRKLGVLYRICASVSGSSDMLEVLVLSRWSGDRHVHRRCPCRGGEGEVMFQGSADRAAAADGFVAARESGLQSGLMF